MTMSVATATVPPPAPPAPCTHPRNAGYEPMYGRMNEYRDLQREMDELSEEERESEEMDNNIRIRGFKTIGRVKTQQEEKQEADEATPEDDEGDSAISGGLDLDASMEDLDESEEEDRFRCLAHAPPLRPCSALYRP